MRITSRDNDLVKYLVKLQKSREARLSDKKFLLDGARLCYDACMSGRRIEAVLCTDEAAARYPEWVARLRERADASYEVSDAVAEKLSETVSPQGVFALCGAEDLARPCGELRPGRFLALERVADPGNLGTILRTAAALGADGLVMTEDCADWSAPKVVRSAMGSLFRLPLYVVKDAEAGVAALARAGVASYAAVLDPEAVPLGDWRPGNAAVWIGNEGSGLTPQAVAACAGKVTIPMAGGVESLNAAVCAAICLWELVR